MLKNEAYNILSPRLRDTSAPSRAARAPIALPETCALTKRHTVGNTPLSAIKKAVAKPFLPPTASKSTFECTLRKSRLNVMCRAVKRHSIHCTGRDSLRVSCGRGCCSFASYIYLLFVSEYNYYFSKYRCKLKLHKKWKSHTKMV